jgi:hypothetical protein
MWSGIRIPWRRVGWLCPQEVEKLETPLYAEKRAPIQTGHRFTDLWLSLFSVPCSLFPAVEKRLQDQGGRHLVDHWAMVLAGVAGFVEDLVSLAGRQTLIPQMNGQARQPSKFVGKGLGLLRLRTLLTGKMEWISDHDGGGAEPPRQAPQRT